MSKKPDPLLVAARQIRATAEFLSELAHAKPMPLAPAEVYTVTWHYGPMRPKPGFPDYPFEEPFEDDGDSPMAKVLPNDKQCLAFIRIVDRRGFPAELDGVPTWEVSDPDVVDLQVAEDGTRALVLAKANGKCQITVRGDARKGPDTFEIFSSGEVEVVGGEAFSLNVQFGDLEDQPFATPPGGSAMPPDAGGEAAGAGGEGDPEAPAVPAPSEGATGPDGGTDPAPTPDAPPPDAPPAEPTVAGPDVGDAVPDGSQSVAGGAGAGDEVGGDDTTPPADPATGRRAPSARARR